VWAKLLNHQNGPEPKFKGLGYFTNTVFPLVFKVTFTTYMGQITNADKWQMRPSMRDTCTFYLWMIVAWAMRLWTNV